MPTVRFPQHLLRHVKAPAIVQAEGATVAEALLDVERNYPGVRDYLVDERGSLRKHVNIFIGEALVRDRAALSDPVTDDAEVFVFQALSGG